MVKNITRYYLWEEPVGIYAPRQLGSSEGYDTFAKAKKEAEHLKQFASATYGDNIWILKATTVYKWSKKGRKSVPSKPRYEGGGIF